MSFSYLRKFIYSYIIQGDDSVLSPQFRKCHLNILRIMQHVNISFYQRQKESTKELPINCRITIKEKRLDISTGVKIQITSIFLNHRIIIKVRQMKNMFSITIIFSAELHHC